MLNIYSIHNAELFQKMTDSKEVYFTESDGKSSHFIYLSSNWQMLLCSFKHFSMFLFADPYSEYGSRSKTLDAPDNPAYLFSDTGYLQPDIRF